MAKKKTGLSGLNDTLFQGINPYSQEQASAAEMTLFDLAEIVPDPNQPRQLLPPSLVHGLFVGESTAIEVIQEWQTQIENEQVDNAQQRKLGELQQLADSIAQHGLINPITIRPPREDESLPPGISYLIVTGERRYWAHVLLAASGKQIQDGKNSQDPAEIKASLVSEGISIRAHQLLENLMREDINAVEKAQGFMALRQELSEVNDSSPDAEGGITKKLVPWKAVEDTLGISKRYRIFITSVLNLSEESQAIVFENDLAEMTIRPITQKLRRYPELQLQALKQLAAWKTEEEAEDGPRRRIVASVRELVDQLLAAREGDVGEGDPLRMDAAANLSARSVQTRRFQTRLQSIVRYLAKLKKADHAVLAQELTASENADLIAEMMYLREQIDTILADVSRENK